MQQHLLNNEEFLKLNFKIEIFPSNDFYDIQMLTLWFLYTEEDDATANLTNDEQDCSSNLSIDNQNLVDDWDSHENQLQDIHLQTTLDTYINNKSSKKIYKAVAKEWGITCKMSEQCRCIDCQGNYFDCEFDEVIDSMLTVRKPN